MRNDFAQCYVDNICIVNQFPHTIVENDCMRNDFAQCYVDNTCIVNQFPHSIVDNDCMRNYFAQIKNVLSLKIYISAKKCGKHSAEK